MSPHCRPIALLGAACIVLATIGGCILDGDDENHPPVIESLSADQTSVYPDSVVTIVVEATDRDHDRLRYDWCASGGSFLLCSSGPTMLWVAPDSVCVCTLSVFVSDEDEVASGSLQITVVDLPRPVIIMDRCPSPRCPNLRFSFHGEMENPEPDELYYTWMLSGSEGAPYTHSWTDWQMGTLYAFYPNPPCGLTYTFRVRCAIPWGDGLLECEDCGECVIDVRCR